MYVSGSLCVPVLKSESLGSYFVTHRNKKKIQITPTGEYGHFTMVHSNFSDNFHLLTLDF